MIRYRLALLAGVALLLGAVGLVAVVGLAPAGSTGAGRAGLVPAADRVPAPAFTGIAGWLNGPPQAVASPPGGALLVDFWTFSCVNCVRTIPHLRALADRFGARGLRIVGVHSPEFDFEKDPAAVAAAVRRLGVTWPVALDTAMATWTAYGTLYWPTEYLLDSAGRVAHTHIGEGGEAETDAAVRALVGGDPAAGGAATAPAPDAVTPELYAGSTAAGAHRQRLGDGEVLRPPGMPTTLPDTAAPAAERDALELSGTWVDRADHVESASPGHVRLRFHAADVFVVAGSSGAVLRVAVSVDGGPPAAAAGPALVGDSVSVDRSDLYAVLAHTAGGDHVLDLAVPAGFLLYTLTFG